jgi:hypothetical protein
MKRLTYLRVPKDLPFRIIPYVDDSHLALKQLLPPAVVEQF